MTAKTEAEAFIKLQEAAITCPEIDQGEADTTMLLVARNTALPRLTLEVVAENERLREALQQVRAMLVIPPASASFADSYTNPYDLQQFIDRALQEPPR